MKPNLGILWDTHFPDQHKSDKKQTSGKLKPGGSPDFLEEFFHPPASSKNEVAETTVDGRFRNPKLTTTVWMVQKKTWLMQKQPINLNW